MTVIYMDNYLQTDHIDAVFGRPDQSLKSWIQTGFQNFSQAVGNNIDQSFQKVQELYQYAISAAREASVDLLRTRMDSQWRQDTIIRMRTLDEIQTAQPIMQRWLMANPLLRTHYLNGEVSAWEGNYASTDPGIGHNHYDYRCVMDGIMTRDKEGEGEVTTHFYEDKRKAEDNLTMAQKAVIISSWDRLEAHLDESDVDPTSWLNETIG